MAGILPTSWAGPNRTLPATFQLSPDQMSRILEMHRESHGNALTYVFIVLFFYVFALVIVVARYLRSEDPDALWRMASTLRQCLCRRRTIMSSTGTGTQAETEDDPNGRRPAVTSPSEQTLSVPPGVTYIESPSPVALSLREVQDTMV